MKILILDDDDGRHKIFAKLLRGHEVVHARKYSEFYKSVSNGPSRLVYLDYDLDIANGSPSRYKTKSGVTKAFTGLDAARLLAAMPKKQRPHFVIVHSMNESGAKKIMDVLGRAKIPYTRIAFPEIRSSLPVE
jgi:CheY-like chemotaxis protein